jgi:PAS domain S-box-containing protein
MRWLNVSGMNIRSHLDLLVLGAVAPLLAISVLAGVLLVEHERETFRREAVGRARSAMSAVDAELRGSLATMQALAASKNLETGDVRAFHAEAQRVLATQQPGWLNIGFARPDGVQLFNANKPFDANPQIIVRDPSFDFAMKARKPVISDLTTGPAVSGFVVRLRLPVFIEGELRYMLAVPMEPETLVAVLVAQQLPAGWSIGLADRNHKFIARLPAVPVGTAVSQDFKAATERALQGWFADRTLEGIETYTPYVTSSFSGWVLGIAIPASLVEAGAWRTFWVTFFGVLAALGTALMLAWYMARRIAEPIADLANAAKAMSTGADVAVPATRRIDEIAHLHDALLETSLAVREREELLDRERKMLREQAELLDLAHDAIMMRTTAGVIKFWSSGAEEMFGWTKSEAIGRVLSELLHTEFPQPPATIAYDLDLLGRWEGTLRHTRKDGARLVVASRWALRRAQSGRSGIVLEIATDITRQTAAEESIARLNQELLEANKRKDHFLATLAHELRNPLAPISNCVTVLKAPGLPERERAHAREVIERQVGQMARLLDDLLDVSRITHGKLELRRSRVALAQVLDTAVETCRPQIKAGGQKLIVDLGDHPVYLNADPIRLAQIVSNLLTNAIKYSNDSSRIWITAVVGGGNVTIAVRDEGIGISAGMLSCVFDIFTQADAAIKRAQGGMGIGLALVRALTELHGGSVEARSDGIGKGSEFIVRLHGAVLADEQDAPVGGGESSFDVPRSTFLVADDLADSADSLAILLRQHGHEVHTAYDGEEALKIAARYKPNVALLDIGMPKLDGHEVARKIREQPWGRDMLLIAVSGWGQRDDRRRTREAGFTHHLVKPLDLSELAAIMNAVPADAGS